MESDFDGPDELPDGPEDWGDEPELSTDDLGEPAEDEPVDLGYPEDAADPEPDEPVEHDYPELAEEQADDFPDEPPAVVDPVGADPDLMDADLADPDDFPLPTLHLDDLPTPAGGPPWIDPSLLGADSEPVAAEPDLTGTPEGARADLGALDADPEASWATLRDAEDPAVRALARLWHQPD